MLEVIISVITVDCTGESDMMSISIRPRLFIQFELKFYSGMVDYLIEVHIFIKPGAFQAM